MAAILLINLDTVNEKSSLDSIEEGFTSKGVKKDSKDFCD